MKKILSMASILALTSGSLFANTDSSDFKVTATVESSCEIKSASELAFGDYDPLATDAKEATNTIQITCSSGTAYSVGLNGGNEGDVNARKMANGDDKLTYAIYLDSDKETVWGETEGTDTIDGTAESSSDTIDLTGYGVLDSEQDVPAGDYEDTITAIVSY
jgi:spore coat protein U-like protein